MMKSLSIVGLAALGLVCMLTPKTAWSQSIVIPVQGYLEGIDGTPMSDDSATLIFRLYEAPEGGSPLYTETLPIPINNGHFTAPVGSIIELNASLFRDYDTLFLGLTVNTDDEMSPRLEFGSVPYAAYSEYAGTAGSLDGITREDLGALVDTWVRSSSYDTEEELTEALDDNYVSDWSDLPGIPAGFGDGVDDDTTYSAGSGLVLEETEFSIDDETIRGMCYDTEAELTSDLDDNYAASDHSHEFADISDFPEGFEDGDDDTLASLRCEPGQVARFDEESSSWRCSSGHNIEVAQNSTGHGWINEVNQREVDAGFRITIEKRFDETPLRIVLSEQIGSNGHDGRVWGAVEVHIDDGSGFRTIRSPGPCSQAWYDNYDYTWNPIHIECLALGLDAGVYEFRVVYSCTGRHSSDCHLGNYQHRNQDGSVAFQRRLIVEELI